MSHDPDALGLEPYIEEPDGKELATFVEDLEARRSPTGKPKSNSTYVELTVPTELLPGIRERPRPCELDVVLEPLLGHQRL